MTTWEDGETDAFYGIHDWTIRCSGDDLFPATKKDLPKKVTIPIYSKRTYTKGQETQMGVDLAICNQYSSRF